MNYPHKKALALFLAHSLVFGQAFLIKLQIPEVCRSHSITKLQWTAETNNGAAATKAKPRAGVLQSLLDAALDSPLWKLVLVPKAKENIRKTADANGIAWDKHLAWISQQEGPWNEDKNKNDSGRTYTSIGRGLKGESYPLKFPEYYTKEFHAYEEGNLCWEAAFEQEIASKAIGARNFPEYGKDGEDFFRRAFEDALLKLGARANINSESDDGIIIDFGCGVGTSTRRLAALFPQAPKIIGIDLSPYFISVGQRLLELAPQENDWVTSIEPDRRIELRVGDISKTDFDDESVDAVNLGLVIHELPIEATIEVCQEALRILKPGGQLFISEMDFDSPAYAAQRENALLFSLIRATEPYLDDYADGAEKVRQSLVENFETVKITAATGRHYALVATKGKTKGGGTLEDTRFDANGDYTVDDTHLKTWESKR